ncbi:MAG: hypothetical protein QOJ11_1984 [Frankiales bacterium]|jgi:hypothetical protein|nr:hypothetical protein [Frankiales bacterium]
MQVVSIDADTNPETVRAYGVMGLPALMKAVEPHL